MKVFSLQWHQLKFSCTLVIVSISLSLHSDHHQSLLWPGSPALSTPLQLSQANSFVRENNEDVRRQHRQDCCDGQNENTLISPKPVCCPIHFLLIHLQKIKTGKLGKHQSTVLCNCVSDFLTETWRWGPAGLFAELPTVYTMLQNMKTTPPSLGGFQNCRTGRKSCRVCVQRTTKVHVYTGGVEVNQVNSIRLLGICDGLDMCPPWQWNPRNAQGKEISKRLNKASVFRAKVMNSCGNPRCVAGLFMLLSGVGSEDAFHTCTDVFCGFS